MGLEEKGKCCNTLGFKIEVTKWFYKVGDFRVSDMVGINLTFIVGCSVDTLFF